MKHILFVITNADKVGTKKVKTGYEFSEVADPYLELIENGFLVDFASLNGGKVPEDGFDENHINSQRFRDSNGFKRLNFSHQLSTVDISAYNAIFFPGGLGPMVDLVENLLVKEIIQNMYESGKIISAVCHGPAALLNVRLSDGTNLLKGKKVTAFTEAEENEKKHLLKEIIPFILENELKKQGGQFLSSAPFESNVVVDGNLITGQNPASAISVAKQVIQKLK